MSDWSDDALTAARKAWHELPPTVPMTVIIMRMVDAVEPIIRADERERIAQAIEAVDCCTDPACHDAASIARGVDR